LDVSDKIIDVPKWNYDTSRMVNDLRVDGVVSSTEIRLPFPSGAGQIGVTTDFNTTGIVLTKTPDSIELLMDSSNPPTTIKEGGTKDASTTHFYYVDKQNKKIVPKTGTTFPSNDYAIINYTWLAPSPVHQTAPDSISNYGLWKQQLTLSDIQSIADAEARTAELLSNFSEPFLLGEFLVDNSSDPGINLGDKVLVVDTINSPNINQELVITKQVLSYPGTSQEINVGDESIRLADWQMNVETRLKRLEELLSLQNQDLILELYDFSNQMQIENRYLEIQVADSSTDSIWGIAVWGTDNWDGTPSPATMHFVSQGEDNYKEYFYDTDFKGTNTTASWTTTNDVTFTSGQVAESSSIDFNNGIIISVKVEVVIDLGSVLIEVTADGTNWETIINDSTHIFSNQGTDLRWRLTENNSSTATVSKVKITGYH